MVLRPHRFLCAALGLYYGGGTLVGLLRLEPAELQAALWKDGAGMEGLWQALLLVLLFLLVLEVVCLALPNATALPAPHVASCLARLTSPGPFAWFAAGVLGVQLFLMATGKIGFSGMQAQEGSSRISPLAALVQPFSMALMMICGYGTLSRDHRRLRLLVLLVQTVLIVLVGRRYAVVGIALAGTGFVLAQPSRAQVVLLLSAAGAATLFAIPTFSALRSAGESERNLALAPRVQEAWTILNTGTTPSGGDFWQGLSENLESRPFIIGYLASLCARPRHYPGTGGKVLLGALAGAVPSRFAPRKDLWMALGAEENLAYEEFRMSEITDEAETPLTGAYLDGRELGVALSVALIVLWLWVMRLLCLSSPASAVSLAVLAATLFCVLFVESGLLQWTVTVRNSLLLWSAGIALHWLHSVLKAWLGAGVGPADQPVSS